MSIKGINSKAELLNFIRNHLQDMAFNQVTSSNGTINTLTCSALLVDTGPGHAVLGTSTTNRLYFNTPAATNNMTIYGNSSNGRIYFGSPGTVEPGFSFLGSNVEIVNSLTVYGTENSIAQEPWTAVTFAADWEDYSTSTYEECSYFKDSMGFVHLRGLAECSDPFAGGDTIFTLPAGYRPSRQGIYNVRSNDGDGVTTCRVNVNTNGTVEATDDFDPVAGAWVSLSGILFDTRAST